MLKLGFDHINLIVYSDDLSFEFLIVKKFFMDICDHSVPCIILLVDWAPWIRVKFASLNHNLVLDRFLQLVINFSNLHEILFSKINLKVHRLHKMLYRVLKSFSSTVKLQKLKLAFFHVFFFLDEDSGFFPCNLPIVLKLENKLIDAFFESVWPSSVVDLNFNVIFDPVWCKDLKKVFRWFRVSLMVLLN